MDILLECHLSESCRAARRLLADMVATRRQVRQTEKQAPEESKPAPRRYTLQEVACHSSPTDCWLIIRRKVYNVSPWIRRHPGGDLLLVKAGRDCTQLFDSYHPISAR